jgi:predicted transcriptional regulator YdeE
MKATFYNRKSEIKGILNPCEYVCCSFSSEQLVTYLFCMEVNEIQEVPEGMLGFVVPTRTYGKTRSNDGPYEEIHYYFRNHNLPNDSRALALEVYPFADPR